MFIYFTFKIYCVTVNVLISCKLCLSICSQSLSLFGFFIFKNNDNFIILFNSNEKKKREKSAIGYIHLKILNKTIVKVIVHRHYQDSQSNYYSLLMFIMVGEVSIYLAKLAI